MALSDYLIPIGMPVEPAQMYNDVSDVLSAEYKKCVEDDNDGEAFLKSKGYNCVPLVTPNVRTPLSEIKYYAYDTIIAICLAFNDYIDAVAKGLQKQPDKVYPPNSLSGFSRSSLSAFIKLKTHESVNTTKPGTPPQDESLPFVKKFYDACGQYVYEIYRG